MLPRTLYFAKRRRCNRTQVQVAIQLRRTPERRLEHADLHADHLFTDGMRLTAVIDWADALVCGPYYELPALHLSTFGGRTARLREFLAG